MKSGYTKYPCFLCKWDTRADREHYSRSIWPECNNLHPGSHNIIYNYLVNPNRILFLYSSIIHFLRSHLDYMPSSCGDFSEEQIYLRKVLSPGYYYNER